MTVKPRTDRTPKARSYGRSSSVRPNRRDGAEGVVAKGDTAFDDLSASLGDPRPHPTEDALVQLGRALMTELVDVISDTAIEDYQTVLGEALLGAFHSAAGRIERDADRARDTM